jgi:hypothetical protein
VGRVGELPKKNPLLASKKNFFYHCVLNRAVGTVQNTVTKKNFLQAYPAEFFLPNVFA